MKKNRLKFAGSLALGLSTAGVLLAAGGQLNFLGNDRPQSQPMVTVKKLDENKPKYSFYENLKKRKGAADEARLAQLHTSPQVPASADAPTKATAAHEKSVNVSDKSEQYRYVVQIGAYAREADAKKLQAQVAALGYTTRIEKARRYLVQIGPMTGKTKAYKIETQLKARQYSTLVKRLK